MEAQLGTLSIDRFVRDAKSFLAVSDKINDHWELKQHTNDAATIYLCKTQVKSCTGITEETELCVDVNDIECDDPAELKFPNENKITLTYEYHIVSSPSYSVPVLYFNVYSQNGSLVSLECIWSLVPVEHKSRLETERWTFISQQEHPILQRPFYWLHPCHTKDLIAQSPYKESRDNYIVTWLSSVGSVVGLELPLEYSTEYTNRVDKRL